MESEGEKDQAYYAALRFCIIFSHKLAHFRTDCHFTHRNYMEDTLAVLLVQHSWSKVLDS